MKASALNEHRIFDSNLLDNITYILNKKFTAEVKIISTQFLSEPERRNCVVRLFLSSQAKEIPKSIILKQPLRGDTDADDEEAYARFARNRQVLSLPLRLSKKAIMSQNFMVEIKSIALF
ncbi:hypothetical protein ACNVED_13180 [Legionella sp. D16C41]|uniref:hypothetical protein n=1 Tax=Legionella sp. D16C41 TaxID=3402688 RepID=UPI003AF776BB